MIKLTKRSGSKMYLAIDHIISILGDDQAVLYTVEDAYQVTEAPEHVARLVVEAKQRKMKLQAVYMECGKYFDPAALEKEDMP